MCHESFHRIAIRINAINVHIANKVHVLTELKFSNIIES